VAIQRLATPPEVKRLIKAVIVAEVGCNGISTFCSNRKCLGLWLAAPSITITIVKDPHTAGAPFGHIFFVVGKMAFVAEYGL